MYLEGVSAYAIAKILNEKEIDSPNTRLEKLGLVKFKAPHNPILWSTHAVLSILRNQVMVGDTVGHKCYRPKIEKNRSEMFDQSQRIIVENTHENIIKSI